MCANDAGERTLVGDGQRPVPQQLGATDQLLWLRCSMQKSVVGHALELSVVRKKRGNHGKELGEDSVQVPAGVRAAFTENPEAAGVVGLGNEIVPRRCVVLPPASFDAFRAAHHA